MPVKLRLRRIGRRKRPIWAVVAADNRRARDGRYIEDLGRYYPLEQPARTELDEGRVMHWLEQGAQPSDTVRSMLSKRGLMLALDLRRQGKDTDEIREAVAEHREKHGEGAAKDIALTAEARRKKALDAERERVAELEAEEERKRKEEEERKRREAEEAKKREEEAAAAEEEEAGGEDAVAAEGEDAADEDAEGEESAPEAAETAEAAAETDADDAEEGDADEEASAEDAATEDEGEDANENGDEDDSEDEKES